MRRSLMRSSRWSSRAGGKFLRRILGMRFPAVETADDLLPEHRRLEGIGGLDHAFCQGGKFRTGELSLRIQPIGKPNNFRLLLGRQAVDLTDDFVGRQVRTF